MITVGAGLALGAVYGLIWVLWATFLHGKAHTLIVPEDAVQLDGHDRTMLVVWAIPLAFFWWITMPVYGWSWCCYKLITDMPERYDPPAGEVQVVQLPPFETYTDASVGSQP